LFSFNKTSGFMIFDMTFSPFLEVNSEDVDSQTPVEIY